MRKGRLGHRMEIPPVSRRETEGRTIDYPSAASRCSYPVVKRTADLALSSLALVVLGPFLAAVAVVVTVDSPGGPLFRQERLGKGGRPFKMYKFRTMAIDAESGGVYESASDPRVTRVGRILRRTSIDELPQLVNVLKGEMSVIGPRPVLAYHPCAIEEYTAEEGRRFLVRPGVTGLAQVNGRKSLSWPDRLALDAEYVRRMSLAFDARILAKTVLTVLTMSDNVNSTETARDASVAERV